MEKLSNRMTQIYLYFLYQLIQPTGVRGQGKGALDKAVSMYDWRSSDNS